jgi:broad specificity phosphatase PhoE
MTRLVFVRHGESMGNKMRVMCGQYDVELTEQGAAQADMTAEYLKDWHFDAAYSSDLSRAYETGLRIMKYHPGMEIKKDTELREVFIGEWEHRSREDIAANFPYTYDLWINDIWNAHPDGGESIQEAAGRIKDAVWRIARENDGGTVLITAHACIIRILTCSWLGMPDERMQDAPWVGNASVSVVDYDTANDTTQLVVLGENSFQGDMATTVLPFDKLK